MSPTAEKEMLDRMRRIETRLTRFLVSQGFENGQLGAHPEFIDGKLMVPTPQCSLKDCLEAVPPGWNKPVRVFVKDEYLTTLD